MNRRSLFKAVALGVASVAAATIAAKASQGVPAQVVENLPLIKTEPDYVYRLQASALPAHTHSICSCGGQHTHGCVVHGTGLWSRQ